MYLFDRFSTKHLFIICFAILIIIPISLFSQNYVRGKLVKQAKWKDHILNYVSGELRVFVNKGATREDIKKLFDLYEGKLHGEIDKQDCYKVSAIDIGGLESGKSTTPGNCIKSDELSKSANESITNTEYKEYKLLPAYPNPSNPSTNISYSIPRNSFVEIKLYDQLGKKIATLYSGNRQQGKYSFTLDFAEVGGGLASGVYIVTMTAENYIESQKINYIK